VRQDQARRLLRQLGSSSLSWDRIEPAEAQTLLEILQVSD
jgi:hypothetical protein